MMARRSPNARIVVYIPHVWVATEQRQQKHLVIHDDRERREAKQKLLFMF